MTARRKDGGWTATDAVRPQGEAGEEPIDCTTTSYVYTSRGFIALHAFFCSQIYVFSGGGRTGRVRLEAGHEAEGGEPQVAERTAERLDD